MNIYTKRSKNGVGFTPTPIHSQSSGTVAKIVTDRLSMSQNMKSSRDVGVKPTERVLVSGFTLIELLVVLGIIGLLTAIVFASVSEARKNTRDKTRKIDLKQMQLTLELYREMNGRYPENCPTGSPWSNDSTSGPYDCEPYTPDWITGLVPAFTSQLPSDPKPIGSLFRYMYNVNNTGTEYKLMAYLTVEVLFVEGKGDEFARRGTSCSGSHENKTYAIYGDSNPGDGLGSECW